MSEAPASSESLPQYRSRLRLPWLLHRRASELIGDGSVQHKTVRFGNLEPTHITLVKRSILPSLVVLTLALCMHLDGRHWSLESYALALVAFLIAAQIFGPLSLNHAETDRAYKRVSRMLLEWSCVVAILMFLSLSFKLTQHFPRSVILSWFLLTPAALLVADWWSAPLAKWFASVRALTQRYIIIGANDLGFELARRIDQTPSGGSFYGFFDYRSAERVSGIPHKPVKGNCSAKDFARYRAPSGDHPCLSRDADFHHAAHRGSDQGIARHDGIHLFRPEYLRLRPGAGAMHRDQRHARALDLRLSGSRHERRVEAGIRCGAGDARTRLDVADPSGDRARHQGDLAGPGALQAAPLRPARRGDPGLQVPHHDGVRGRLRRRAGDQAGPANHPARGIPAPHVPG